MRLLAVLCLALVALPYVAATHQFVSWYSPSGWNIIYMSATWVVPTRPSAATYYVWPGVQDGTGVLQSVLDGRKASWWLGSGWYGTPSLPWGGGATVNNGNTVYGTLKNTGDGSPKGNWASETGYSGGSVMASNSWALSGKSFTQAVFDVETYGVTWNFGPVNIPWLEVKSNSPKTGWCSNKLATGGSIGYSIGNWWTYSCGSYCTGCLYQNLKIWSTSTAARVPSLSELFDSTDSLSEPLPPPSFVPEAPVNVTVVDVSQLPPH